jgi:ligand-binding sensor domain-containing protein/DNA-binding CsgD family transcriptional regulator
MCCLQLFVVVTTCAAESYESSPCITNYTSPDYRAARQNWALTQDRQGIMYFANGSGMLVFDGVRWQVHALPGDRGVRTVAFDSLSQRIYCGTFEEFGYWERDEFNALNYHSVSDSLRAYTMHNDEIWSINFVGDTVIFRSFATYFLYHRGTVRAAAFPAVCLAMNKVHGHVYAATIDGLYVLRDSTFELLRGGKQFAGDRQINALLPFDDKNMLIATQGDGLYLYNGESYRRWTTTADALLVNSHVNRALAVQDSLFLFGTIMNGVVAVDRQGTQLWHLNQATGLQNNTVLGMFEDREGNVWLGLDNGIDCMAATSPLYFYRGHNDNVEAVYAVMEHGNALYLATNKGLFRSAAGEGRFTMVPETQGQVWDLAVWDGQLLCGHNAGTFRIEGNRAIPISGVTGGYCLRLFPTSKGNVLLQSTYTQLVVYRQNVRGLWQFSHVIPDFIEPVRYLETDHLGNIWAGHIEKGVFRIRLNETLTEINERRYYHAIGDYNADRVGVFKVNGRIVFTTGRELFTYDDIHDSIVPYRKLNEALGKFAAAHKIMATGNNYWFACSDELACVTFDNAGNCRTLLQIPYSALKNQVMINNEWVYTNRQQASFIGLSNGFAMLNERQKPLPAAPAAILLRSIEAYTKKQQRLLLEPDVQQAQLSSPYRTVKFTFAYPSFSSDGVKLWYKLDGLEKEWLPVAGNYEKEYSRLPAGEYVFAVKAVGPSGHTLAQTQYAFVIRSPWYAGKIAFGGYGILALALLFFSYKIGYGKLQRQHQKLLRKEEERRREELAQQEQKIIRLKNEKLEAEVLFKAKELAVSAMAITQKNNVLLTLKQELQKEDSAKNIKHIVKLINKNLSSEKDWQVFEANFDLIHDRFFRNLKERTAQLTPRDLKLCAYLRLNLTTKEIAQLTGNSVRGVEVARFRLRKKLQLDPEQNLNEFMLEFKG